MDRTKLNTLKFLLNEQCLKIGKESYWKTLKEAYLKLTTDEEKNKFLAMIFKDSDNSNKKEGN